MRRRPVPERREHRPEAPVRLLLAHADRREDLLLDVRAVDPDAPRRELRSVGDKVVELPNHLQGVRIQKGQVFFPRHREHVVHRLDASLVLVPLEEREVRYPGQREHVGVGELETIPQVKPQAVQALEDDRVHVRDEEHIVALARAQGPLQGVALLG